MAEVVTPTTEPSYIINLALNDAPFNDSPVPKSFYGKGQAGHRLNLLRHLIYSGDKIANLCAEEGLGKTTLLNQLSATMSSEVKICLLDANNYPDITTILAKSLIDLGVDSSEVLTASQPEMILERRLRQLEKAGIKYILLIDNCDVLDSNTLESISVWLTWQSSDKYLLGAVFASKQAIELHGEAKNRLQKVELPTLSDSEVAEYLSHRLAAVGFEQALPFSEQDIKRIY